MFEGMETAALLIWSVIPKISVFGNLSVISYLRLPGPSNVARLQVFRRPCFHSFLNFEFSIACAAL